MRLILQKIYEIADAKLARRKLHAWCRWVRWVAGRSAPVLFAAVVKTAKMIERHLEGVMARPMNRITNVFLEGRNSIFSAVKRKAAVFVRPRVLPQCFASPPGAFPLPSEPTPRRTLVYCRIFEASDRAERSNSSAQLHFNDALKPPRRPQFQKMHATKRNHYTVPWVI